MKDINEGTSGSKYPVLLVHGMGFRDRKYLNYWGRIPKALEKDGVRIFYGGQDSSGSVEGNAAYLAERIRQMARENGIEKFNVIAHSKGGLDIRYAISTLKINDLIASVTTINTPHNGSYTVDKLLKIPDLLVKFGCRMTDWWFRVLGDRMPETYKAIKAFETVNAEEFNRNNPDDPGIYYQSYAFTCKKITGDMFMWFSNLVVRSIEGENDGLLTPRAVKWSNFRGHFTGVRGRGISHCDEVDIRRRPILVDMGDRTLDIPDLYREIVRELGEMGY